MEKLDEIQKRPLHVILCAQRETSHLQSDWWVPDASEHFCRKEIVSPYISKHLLILVGFHTALSCVDLNFHDM